MRLSDRPIRAAALAFGLAAASLCQAQTPQRVVSINLCTDQMALMLAAPGQLVSVTHLATDPRSSAMIEAARSLPANRGRAEEVVLHAPDLILAGTWTAQASVQMLESLGYRVARFAPARSIAEARANIARLGDLLGRRDAADAMLAAFDARLSRLGAETGPAPRVAFYQANGFATGRDTLAGDILAAAGLRNIAEEEGLPTGGKLPLEGLLLTRPDLILIGAPYAGHARATEILTHPALHAAAPVHEVANGAHWMCETPFLLDALAEMVALRRDWASDRIAVARP